MIPREKTKAEIYMEAGQKGAGWLCSRQNNDGSIGTPFGVGGMYKTVWSMVAGGYLTNAARLLDWTKKNIMATPGEFHFNHENAFDKTQCFYRNCFILLGAYKLGRFDICSEEAINQVLRYQDKSGGFYANLDDKKSKASINLLFTVVGGWVSLYFGKINEAIKTGNFIVDKMVDPQPNFDNFYYCNWDPKNQSLITKFDPNTEPSNCVNAKRASGPFYYSGAVAGFLTELFERTGDKKFLDGAIKSMSFSYNTIPESYTWPSKCKEGWGAALLYRQTQDPKHREIAEKVAEITFMGAQLQDGSFQDFLYPFTLDGSEGAVLSSIEITSEFSFELTEIARGLTI